MPKIKIQNLHNKTISHPTEDNSKSILHILHGHGIDWMHACGGKGRCTSCKMIVLSGMDHLNPETMVEKKYREQKRLGENERLTCQCYPCGDITIRLPDGNKMPHIKYSD